MNKNWRRVLESQRERTNNGPQKKRHIHVIKKKRKRKLTQQRMGGKKVASGAQKRKKKREKEKLAAETERLKLGPTKLWTGLVLHHKDVFVSHVISKLNTTDRWFFALVNRESWDVLAYAGVDVSKLCCAIYECTSISTLEFAWNHTRWGEKSKSGTVMDQAWFCGQVATTNKIELLKWAREVKQCEWDAVTINQAAFKGNLEMLKYCFSNECPCDEERSCEQAAIEGNLDSSISFRQSGTFARYGRRCGNTSNMPWSRRDREIFRRRKKDI